MKFKNNKCIEITKSEYDDIMFINDISSCSRVAIDNVKEYLIRDNKINRKLDSFELELIAYNLYMATINNYKYMKVVD